MHHQFFERSGRVDGGGDAPRRPDPPKPLAPRSRRRNRERADAEYERGVRREVQQAPGHADDGRPHPRQRAPQTRVDPHRAARAQIVDEHVRDADLRLDDGPIPADEAQPADGDRAAGPPPDPRRQHDRDKERAPRDPGSARRRLPAPPAGARRRPDRARSRSAHGRSRPWRRGVSTGPRKLRSVRWIQKCRCGRLSRGFAGYAGEPSQAAAEGRPLAVAAEVGREGGEGGAVREAARAVFESAGEGARVQVPSAKAGKSIYVSLWSSAR